MVTELGRVSSETKGWISGPSFDTFVVNGKRVAFVTKLD
jgi:hypothetical protein